MGIKEGLLNKMVNNMIGKIDFDSLQKQMGQNGGKLDANSIQQMMSNMLNSKEIKEMQSNISDNNDKNEKKDDKKIEDKNAQRIKDIEDLTKQKKFGYEGICKIIQQRPPFLMVDKVLDIDVENRKVVCQKCVSSNEGFFVGHFPERPVMPGVLMVEAMAQAASIIGNVLLKDKEGVLVFAELNNTKFRDGATAGDVLIVESQIQKIKGPLVIGECKISKNNEVIVSCEMKAFKKII